MNTIDAGLLSDIKNLANKLISGLDGVLTKLMDAGLEFGRGEETEEGGMQFELENDQIPDGGVITYNPSDEEGKINLQFESGNVKRDFGKVPLDSNKIATVLNQFTSKTFGFDIINSSKIVQNKSLKVTLHRAEHGDTASIQMTKVAASYNMVEAMEVLGAVLGEDSFVDLVTEDGASFDIIDDGSDELEIIQIDTDDIDVQDTALDCLYAAIVLYNNFKKIHWHAAGPEFFRLHELADYYARMVSSDIDTLGEIFVETLGWAPNPGLAPTDRLIISRDGIERDAGFELIRSEVNNYLITLDTYYVNFPHDIQSVLDNIIRFWSAEIDYKLRRALLTKE